MRREEVKNKVLEHYRKKKEEVERIIAEIESNPRVMEQLRAMAEKEMKEEFARREREKQKSNQLLKKIPLLFGYGRE